MKIESSVHFENEEIIYLEVSSKEGTFVSDYLSDLFEVFEIVKWYQESDLTELLIKINIGGFVSYIYKKNWEEKNDK